MIVSGRVYFDAFGRTTRAFYPVTEAMGMQTTFNPMRDNLATPTQTYYDVVDRPIWEILPDNARTNFQYGFGADRNGNTQFHTRVIDPEGNRKDSYTNVRGLTTATLEDRDQEIADKDDETFIWTSFVYNPINELKEVFDDHQNKITSAYDWLGRRTSVKHPDAGESTFEYDFASNLIKKTTAKLLEKQSAIEYEYFFERLTNINYPFNTYNDVTYTYGEADEDLSLIRI